MPKDRRTSPTSTAKKSRYLAYKSHGKAPMDADPYEASLPKKEWKDALCPICMDFPHNAVLLLCSSHDKGCRPYICNSSYRHSNCLDQYQKAGLGKVKTCASSNSVLETSTSGNAVEEGLVDMQSTMHNTGYIRNNTRANSVLTQGIEAATPMQGAELDGTVSIQEGECRNEGSSLSLSKGNTKGLLCPICRGEVMGWKVVKSVREYFNNKPKSCAQETCTFEGSYKELRIHARHEHPLARPSEIDPVRARDWSRMERRRDVGDVLSTIHSTMPGATVIGDYVIEPHGEGEEGEFPGDDGHWWTMSLLFQIFGHSSGSGNEGMRLRRQLRVPRRSLWGESLSRNNIVHVDSTTSSGSSDAEEIPHGSAGRRQRRAGRSDH